MTPRLKRAAIALAFGLASALGGCVEARLPHLASDASVAAHTASGRVTFETERQAQATLAEVGNTATVSLIDATTGNTVAASLTDGAGNFVLTFPTFTPQPGMPYVLEAVKGLSVGGSSNRAGTAAVRLRSLLFWNNGWQSLTNTTVNVGIVVSAGTTAVATIASLKDQAGLPLTLATLIGTVNGSTFTESGTGLSNLKDFTPVLGMVTSAITLDQDPLRTISYDNAKGIYSLATGVPWISGYSPAIPVPGATVTVTGGNLDKLNGRNLFYFGATAASTWSVSADRTTATVTIPASAYSAPFTLVQPNGVVQTISPFLKLKGTVGTIVGNGTAGGWDAVGTNASLNGPYGLVLDGNGNLYWSDEYGHRIRKMAPNGMVTTLAGDGVAGNVDGTGQGARVSNPCNLAVDAAGNLYLAGYYNQAIRMISPAGVVTTLAGSGNASYADGVGTAAGFACPIGIARDAAGNLYIGDNNNRRIRKMTPTGVVTTLSGSGVSGIVDGPAGAAQYADTYGLAVDGAGNLFVSENSGCKIRKVTLATGYVATYAGTGASGFADGATSSAVFKSPHGLATDPAGNLYVADRGNYRIRKITPGGVVSTVAGTGVAGYTDGSLAVATFTDPTDVRIDPDGNVYMADRAKHVIRVITP